MARKRKPKVKKELLIYEFQEIGATAYCSGCGQERVPVGSLFIRGNLKGSGEGGFLVLCPVCRATLKEKL